MGPDPSHEHELVTRSPEETERFAERLGTRLFAGVVIALEGEMGTGKTTFVRGLARGLAVPETPTSPTFVLMQEYRGRLPLYHFDAWMSARGALFLEGGGAEYLGGEGVAVVEWAERVEAFLPRPYLRVRLAYGGEGERRVRVGVVGEGEELRPLIPPWN